MEKYAKRYGKKALIIYICWCTIKGIAYLTLGKYLLS